MDSKSFREQGHRLVDWVADYMDGIEDYPVRAATRPGEIAAKLPARPPETGEAWDDIIGDLDRVIMPGITHWQHPMFMAYFPCTTSPPAVLAELVIAGLGVQGMMWETSPAATELEIRVMDWLARALGLPDHMKGVIQDTASTATLCAVLAARERVTGGAGNKDGASALDGLVAYTSDGAHTSVDKAIRIAGIGDAGLRKIPVTADQALDPEALEQAIEADQKEGLKPFMVVATLGTTGAGGLDELERIAEIAQRHDLWLHVDGAWAGSALLLPEHRDMARGLEHAQSFVMNPHKWLLTGMDFSALYVADAAELTRAFAILPEYLKSDAGGEAVDFRDWGIALGRRFRALKLWFVMRSYGLEGLRAELRRHIALAHDLATRIGDEPDFEILVPPSLALFVFRYRPARGPGPELDALNETLLARLNDSGEIYLTRIRIGDAFAIRVSVGQTGVEARHMDKAFDLITGTARAL